MNKRIKKKLSKRGGYKRYKNWNSWTKMKAWARAIMALDIKDDQFSFRHRSRPPSDLPAVMWKNYNTD